MKVFKTLIIFGILLLILFTGGRLLNKTLEQQNIIDSQGHLKYQERGKIEYTSELLEDTYYTKEKIVFDSKGTPIHAHLYKPLQENSPAIIIAPASAGPKEGQEWFAKELVKEGYAVMVLDQRGVGETKWAYTDPQSEFDQFMQHKTESTAQLMVYDFLKAFDVLQDTTGIDKNNIIAEGESMGGRVAMIASGIEVKIKGAIILSSSGYGLASGPSAQFVNSIDPNYYVSQISPRRLVMFHSPIDSVIPIQLAKATYTIAKEPKNFIEMPQGCNHGNCDQILPDILKELELIRNS